MSYRLTGPTPEVRDQRDAIDKLEGLPRPPERTGTAADALVPDEYYEGAFGWTAHACNFVEHFDEETGEPTGEATMDVPDHLAARHQGESAVLDDGRTVVVDLSGAEHIEDAPLTLQIAHSQSGPDAWGAEVVGMPGTFGVGATSHEALRRCKAAALRLLAPVVELGEVQLEALRFAYLS